MGRIVLDEWHIRVEVEVPITDPQADTIVRRFALLVADAARSIEEDLRSVGVLGIVVSFDR